MKVQWDGQTKLSGTVKGRGGEESNATFSTSRAVFEQTAGTSFIRFPLPRDNLAGILGSVRRRRRRRRTLCWAGCGTSRGLRALRATSLTRTRYKCA
eukprot:gene57596-biopygen112040